MDKQLMSKVGLRASKTEVAVIGIVLWALVVIVFAGTIIRYLPVEVFMALAWVEELARFLLLCLTWWGAAYVMRKDGHFCFTVIVNRLGFRARSVVRLIAGTFTLALIIVLIMQALHLHLTFVPQVTQNTHSPMIIKSLPLLIGSMLLGVYAVIGMVKLITGLAKQGEGR